MRTLLALFMLCTLCLAPAAATAGVIHVPADQPTIQAGIDAAVDGDVVLVAEGVWTGPGNRDLDFNGKPITVGSLNGPQNCIIDCEGEGRGFHFHSGEGLDSVVRGFTIRNGVGVDPWHAEGGGGILVDGAAPQISSCIFTSNHAMLGGGFNVRPDSGGLITDCVFRNNVAENGGGLALDGDTEVRNCLIMQNEAYNNGGGINSGGGTMLFRGCTIIDNYSTDLGGGFCVWDFTLTMDNCIVWGNTAELTYPQPSDEGYFGGYDAFFSSSYCCLGEVWYVDAYITIEPGPGNIGDDPIFTLGPEGDWYLSQVASGQAVDSPCVDAGDPAWAPDGTTRTDHEPDTGVRDMGYHHPDEAADSTVTCGFACDPTSGTLPFSTTMTATLTNTYIGQRRRIAAHIDVNLAGGQYFPNWRAGFTNITAGSTSVSSWIQYLPALGTLVGTNTFTLIAEDVTPVPYNLPPYPPAGDIDTTACTVVGIVP